jgi:hypothetical protein
MEKVAAALEEFKSIYGKYPPVRLYPTDMGVRPLIYYEFPMSDTYGSTKKKRQETIDAYIDNDQAALSQWSETEDGVFTFGLCSFFVPRVYGAMDITDGPNGMTGGAYFLKRAEYVRKHPGTDKKKPQQWTDFNNGNELGDPKRDLDAVRRILPLLGERMKPDNTVDGLMARKNEGVLQAPWDRKKRLNQTKTNEIVTIRDAWGNDLNYWSVPPYETYKLWSCGPDAMTVGSKCRNPSHGHQGEHGSDWAGEFWRVAEGEKETDDDIVIGIY